LSSNFLHVFVSVDSCCVLVVFLSSSDGDQDDKEEEEEQAVDGDTHSNQTCLERGEFMVIRRGAWIACDDAVGVRKDGDSIVGRLDDDEIGNLPDEMDVRGFPFVDFQAVCADEDVGGGRRELDCVRHSEVTGAGAATIGVGGVGSRC